MLDRQYEFVGYSHEHDHLRNNSDQERELRHNQITELLEKGVSQRQISKKLNVGLTTVNRVVQMMGEDINQ
jgi:Trp operon repressor